MILPPIKDTLNPKLFDAYDKVKDGVHQIPFGKGYIQFTKKRGSLDFDLWRSDFDLGEDFRYVLDVLEKEHHVSIQSGKTYITVTPSSKSVFCDIVGNLAIPNNTKKIWKYGETLQNDAA